MDPRKSIIPVDELRWKRNTVQLNTGMPNIGGRPSRYGFFTCMTCDVTGDGKPDGTGFLFEANISHYCDDCGGPLIMWIRL